MASNIESSSHLTRPSLLRMLSRSGQGPNACKDAVTEEDAGELLLRDLPTPAFVINRHAFAKNCQAVLDQASAHQFKLRPHVKTHKSLEGVHLQATGTGANTSPEITGFVASTLPEVKLLVNYFTSRSVGTNESNAQSIVYGMPISETKLPALWALQERMEVWQEVSSTQLNKAAGDTKIVLLMDHPQQVEMVQRFFQSQEQLKESGCFQVMIKLDTGYHRAGVPCDDADSSIGTELLSAIVKTSCVKLVGVYSHCGHAYDVEDKESLDKIVQTDMDQIQSFLQRVVEPQNSSILEEDFTISVGSTPSLWNHSNPNSNDNSQSPWWKEFLQKHPKVVLELHPGNYTLYDRQQLYTKACPGVDSIAGRVMTRVIGQYNDKHRPNTILMDAGATALTKETTPQGGTAAISSNLQADVYKMSQEVSMARGATDAKLGSLLSLLPNHSCLAAACFEKYYVIDDPTNQFAPDTPIVEEWDPVKGW